MRIGWSDSATISAAVFERTGARPANGVSLADTDVTLSPPFPPSLAAETTLNMHLWFAAPATDVIAIRQGVPPFDGDFTTTFVSDKAGTDLTVDGTAGTAYVSRPLTTRLVAQKFVIRLVGELALIEDDVEQWARTSTPTSLIPLNKMARERTYGTEVTWTYVANSNRVQMPHGLDRTPDGMHMDLVCITADKGYPVGPCHPELAHPLAGRAQLRCHERHHPAQLYHLPVRLGRLRLRPRIRRRLHGPEVAVPTQALHRRRTRPVGGRRGCRTVALMASRHGWQDRWPARWCRPLPVGVAQAPVSCGSRRVRPSAETLSGLRRLPAVIRASRCTPALSLACCPSVSSMTLLSGSRSLAFTATLYLRSARCGGTAGRLGASHGLGPCHPQTLKARPPSVRRCSAGGVAIPVEGPTRVITSCYAWAHGMTRRVLNNEQEGHRMGPSQVNKSDFSARSVGTTYRT